MIQFRANGPSVLGLLGLFLWVASAQAVLCQNNLPASNPDSVYADHGNGTVTDTRTGLMWKQCAEGFSGTNCQVGSRQDLTWAEALDRAESSTFAGYEDWRLPNVKELSSLVEDCRASPAINTNHFPNTPPAAGFWTGSPSAFSSNDAWIVVFAYGEARYLDRSNGFRVRLVRGGQ